jgi:hypothetical protein
MARKQDATVSSSPNQGWDMIKMARATHTPSPANGVHPSGVAAAGGNITSATYSPGAVLGTGMNTDRYTPGAEAV